jgi:hypothetical protein
MERRKMKEVLEKCRYCNAPLKLKISETSIHTFQGHRNEFTIKHEPSLACTKCNNRFQAEPYQHEKTRAFLDFLMSVKLKKAEIEYKDMMMYVDNVLKFKGDE